MPKVAAEKPAKETKTKRAPTPYQLFVKEQMPIWKEKNPTKKHTDAMKDIAALWKTSEANPNKGGEGGAAPKKAPAKKAAPKKKAKKSSDDDESAGDDE